MTRGATEWAEHWPGRTFDAVLRQHAAETPDQTAVADSRHRLTYGALDAWVDRVAAGLSEQGVSPGDVVTSQLPNRVESVVVCYAANRIGAVHNPVVPIYGPRELDFIRTQAQTKVFLGPDDPLPESDTSPPATSVDPDEVAVILYTSGSTADPKGVLHSCNTLGAECAAMAEFYALTADEVFVMPSPVGHISGLLYGVLLPVWLGATAHLLERWDPGRFLEVVERERGTFCGGPTVFLQGVVDHPDLERYDTSSLRLFPTGGADVDPDLIRKGLHRLKVRTGRGYGSTEFPSITSSTGADEPEHRRIETEGRPIGANRIELRDGEIWAKGPELCLGYRDSSLDAESFDGDGWFRTGDLGEIDAEGYLTIVGRVKDIVIRRGEKISARELELLLAEHPAVAEVAIVAMPDPERGELACAVVVPATREAAPNLDDLTGYLLDRGLSRRKLPERLEVVDALPRNAAGKVQKAALKAQLAG